jgi:hypothetical protein
MFLARFVSTRSLACSQTLTLALTMAALPAALPAALCNCSSETQTATPGTPPVADRDAGNAVDAATMKDAGMGEPDAPTGPSQTEMEPNNGAATTEVNTMIVPGTMSGKIDPANDSDIFSVDVMPGQYWEWTATPSADLAPLVTLFDTAPASLNPTAIAPAGAGVPATLQHFVLRPGKFVVAMRDARNRTPSQNKGGPSFGYALAAKQVMRTPVAVTFPSIKQGRLTSLGGTDLYAFTTTTGKGFDIIVRASRKAPASTLDARLSLYDVAGNKAIITNDNTSTTIPDPQVGSASEFSGNYMVVVDNEGTNDADLSYEIEFKLRP